MEKYYPFSGEKFWYIKSKADVLASYLISTSGAKSNFQQKRCIKACLGSPIRAKSAAQTC